MVNIGDTAPAFTLKNTQKSDVSLADYAGKTVILAFYPGAFTGVCDKEMCAFQDNLDKLNSSDSTVLGISVDSPWANAEFARKYNLEFTLLSDLDRDVVLSLSIRTVLSNIAGLLKTPVLSQTMMQLLLLQHHCERPNVTYHTELVCLHLSIH
jgi:peroxiredoxin